jgi:penicillin G amidase
MDLYIENLNPQNPDQYEVNGRWTDMQIVNETIRVAGENPVALKVRYTRHGPVISDSYRRLKDFSQKTQIGVPPQYAISLRWTALDPTILFPAIWQMNIAQNWKDFREAASHFDVPSQNIVYADIDGNIAYQAPGKIPIRKNGDGRYPVPGWTDEYEWTGFIPFEELPYALNPSTGFIATANNAVTTRDYQHFIASDWDYGFRAQRIVNMIEKAEGPLSSANVQQMQGDNFSGIADAIIPVLLNVPLNDAHLSQLRETFRQWDREERIDSSQAALFEVFWKHLLADTFHDDLPEDQWPSGGSRSSQVIRDLLTHPDSAWWDNRKTPDKETRDDILKLAFSEAVQELEKRFGTNPQNWRWGGLHTVSYKNAVFGNTGIALLDWLFNRGPYPTAGGSAIVNATSWDATESYEVTSLPSMRMLVDFSDFDHSLTVHSPGQSGHAFHRHYNDLVDLWRNIRYYPMLWSRKDVEANTKEVLYFEPTH